MNNNILYFAALIHILFGIAFSYAITDGWNFKKKKS